MKILLVIPIPVEYKACKEIFPLEKEDIIYGCRTGKAVINGCKIYTIQSGPAKSRAAMATIAAIEKYYPDVVLDTGSCAGIQPGTIIKQIIIGKKCVEYDISGVGVPKKRMAVMNLYSGFDFLPFSTKELLLRNAAEYGRNEGFNVFVGIQACGEFIINSIRMRELLYNLFHAAGGNWESAGVFISALRACLPVFSVRVITDLGNKNALLDFRQNVKPCAKELYKYIRVLIEAGWFSQFIEDWQKLSKKIIQSLVKSVRP